MSSLSRTGSAYCPRGQHTIRSPIISSLYLAEASSKNNNLIYFAHLFQEVVDPRSLKNVEMMPVILNFNWDDKIGLLYRLENFNNKIHPKVCFVTYLETTVNKRFVEIKYQAFSASVFRGYWWQ
jgi:hypothetical protein